MPAEAGCAFICDKMSFSITILCYMILCSVLIARSFSQDIIGCGGFVKSEVEINFSLIEVKLYSKAGSLKYQTDCAPNNGYYMIPVYDKGEYVLKVEPPPGWTFQPESFDLVIDGKNDLCSKGEDINFQFTGFGVVGKVVSLGQSSGPAGISLSLRKPNKQEVVKQTTSSPGGEFTFENVLPGDYVVTGTHDKWTFEKASVEVKVGRETGNAGDTITVHGYDVTGEVVSEGEAIQGVNFVLFSDKKQPVKGCQTGKLKGFKSQSTPLCYAVSAKNGQFSFTSLPVGDYTLVPFYQGEQIVFDVAPSKLEFSVNHDSIALKERFEVTGFSVSGKVLMSKSGKGIPGALVYLNGKNVATTGADGSYTLESMKAGTYSLGVQAERLQFSDTQVKITPNSPQLPPLVAEKYSSCGAVIIDKLPPGLDNLHPERKVKVLQGSTEVATATTDGQGKFCAQLKPGTYVFKVELSSVEDKAGLKLAPVEREVKVVDRPVDSIKFSQFRANIKGSVKCLENCGSLQLSLAATGRVDERQMVQSEPAKQANTAAFSFSDVMPGKYRVSILNEDWCWEEKGVEIEVEDKDMTDIKFSHTGYILSCSLSHDITLNFEQEGRPGNVGSFSLTKGVNKFCLGEPGKYKLSPKSCHQFEQQIYTYDTSKPEVLSLSAVRHLVEGQVTTAKEFRDISVNIKSSVEEAATVISPLTAEKSADKKATSRTYKFTYWARSGEKLEVTPSSAVLLFYPPNVHVSVVGDACPGLAVDIEGREGVFIEGLVSPALAGVKMTITGEEVINIDTDDMGKFKVGPLHADQEYTVDAEKEGYIMTAIDGKLGHFNAFKLAEINVKVTDESGEALPGVLLSLSGGNSYRSNQLTDEAGARQFLSLSPGQYFLRPMMKEFKFEPSSQMLDVAEGATVNQAIKGTRVAYSCYGSVTSLNGEPEPGVIVEAVGKDGDCAQLQEESKTEADGSFRIRGLQPGCFYDIGVRPGVNAHIERTAPKVRTVKVENGDLTKIHMIAFRRMNQMDLSGNIITDQQYLPNLKVLLFRESNPDSAIHTVKMDQTSFFHLPSLTIDNQQYVLRLESTLSRATYTYQTEEIVFTANTTYQHFTFKFQPQVRSIEQELSQSSFLILPLTFLVIFISYNSKQILPLVWQLVGYVQAMISGGPGPTRSRGSTPPPSSSGAGLEISPELLMPSQPQHRPKVRKT